MGKLAKRYLSGGVVYRCSACRSHLALHDGLVSKAFQGRHGRAYLFRSVINVSRGPTEDRLLTTGLHTVCDIYCNECDDNIGWFYEAAYEPSQKYKVGKFILEKAHLVKDTVHRARAVPPQQYATAAAAAASAAAAEAQASSSSAVAAVAAAAASQEQQRHIESQRRRRRRRAVR